MWKGTCAKERYHSAMRAAPRNAVKETVARGFMEVMAPA